MADLAASAVTVQRFATEGGVTGKDRVRKHLKLVLTGQGGSTNKITASSLGFSVLESCSNGWDATNSKVYPCVVNTAGTALHIADAANATATNHTGLLDLTTSDFRIEVCGQV